jgi:uncharacterized protein YbjQ (UPF0145 family)
VEKVVIFTSSSDVTVDTEIGPVSVLDVSDRVMALACLKAKAYRMGANAIVDFRMVETVGDPYFETRHVYARGTAVKI